MTVDQLAPEVLKLPSRDRALLAAFLWESLEDPYLQSRTDDPDDLAALALSDQRDAEMDSGLVTPIPHADLMSRLRR